MPSLGWQELTILFVILVVLWILPIVLVVRTATAKGRYTPWIAIILMVLFGGWFNFLWAAVWWAVKGRDLGRTAPLTAGEQSWREAGFN